MLWLSLLDDLVLVDDLGDFAVRLLRVVNYADDATAFPTMITFRCVPEQHGGAFDERALHQIHAVAVAEVLALQQADEDILEDHRFLIGLKYLGCAVGLSVCFRGLLLERKEAHEE
jgi:hypothetical protein